MLWKLSAALFVCSLLLSPLDGLAEEPTFLSGEEARAVDRALSLLKMDRVDISFNKDYVNHGGIVADRWRLDAIDTLLHEPLFLPDYSARLTEEIKEAGDSFARFLQVASAKLDRPVPPFHEAPEPQALPQLLRRSPNAKKTLRQAGRADPALPVALLPRSNSCLANRRRFSAVSAAEGR